MIKNDLPYNIIINSKEFLYAGDSAGNLKKISKNDFKNKLKFSGHTSQINSIIISSNLKIM